ncbi:MAG: phosphomannomutase [Erythrobacter sp.]
MGQQISVNDLMKQSGVMFGTSGARGLVSAMSDRVCYGYTIGFLRYLMAQGSWQADGIVSLAGDLRPSTPRILAACSAAVRMLGGTPEFCGFVPTPALAFHAIGAGVPAIMVTGSHIPDDRNGIKFYRPDGEILKDDEPGILSQLVDEDPWDETCMFADPAALLAALDISPAYVERYVRVFGQDALKGFRIGVYQHSAVGRDILVDVLGAIGADVVPLGRADRFIPVDTEAIRPEDIALAKQWATEHRLDALVSTDGDSDRPLLADENGDWLRGDVLAMLCAVALGMHTVITPVSSNSMVELSGYFSRVERTRIGSPFVIKGMQAALARGDGPVCGYEANGGFLLGSDVMRGEALLTALPTRDAVLPILAVLAAAKGGSVSRLVDALPRRFTYSDRIQDFSPERRFALMAWLVSEEGRNERLYEAFGPVAGGELASIDLTDGVRMAFANGRVVHLRGSGNAPELRCYTEAEALEVARALARAGLRIVEERF